MSVLDTLRAATPTRKTVTMCLDGALQAEWEQALEGLDAAAKADTDNGSLAMPASTQAIDHMDALREKVAASKVTFLFAKERLSWPGYMAMQADHPPREGNLLDRMRGFNTETFYPALIRATCLSVQGAEGDSETVPDGVWDALLGDDDEPGSLNLKQVSKLADAADYVMNGETRVPPSARSLLESQDFGASLAQPSPGTSPRDGSEGGSRRTSPMSSTTKKARSKARSDAT